MQEFKSRNSAPRFLTSLAAIYNVFAYQRHLIDRGTLWVLRARADEAWTVPAA